MTSMHSHFSGSLAVVGALALGAAGCVKSLPPTEQASVIGGSQQGMAGADDLETQLKALSAKQTDRGVVVTLEDVLFDSNRAELRSSGPRDMAKLVDFFERYPKRTALIEGFTDNQGSSSANLGLLLRRGGAVRHALIDQGVFAGRLDTRGYGDAYPVSTNSTEAGRQMNRRVEIVLSGDDGTVAAR